MSVSREIPAKFVEGATLIDAVSSFITPRQQAFLQPAN